MEKTKVFTIVKAVCASIFVCPGVGHAMLGRKKSGIVAFVIFALIAVVLSFHIYQLVQKSVSDLQVSGAPLEISRLMRIAKSALKEDPTVSRTLWELIFVYFTVPVELVLHELIFRKKSEIISAG
ncbi:MAG: hypothetical protein HQM10_16205 [Candidatus Riflebacteria bacterium]|nr:hypothetical protein [Candidatus Riflebacteria bacterium]